MMLLRIINTHCGRKQKLNIVQIRGTGSSCFMIQNLEFLGFYLLLHGVSRNKEAVNSACVFTTPCGRNIPFRFQLVLLKTDLFAVHLLG